MLIDENKRAWEEWRKIPEIQSRTDRPQSLEVVQTDLEKIREKFRTSKRVDLIEFDEGGKTTVISLTPNGMAYRIKGQTKSRRVSFWYEDERGWLKILNNPANAWNFTKIRDEGKRELMMKYMQFVDKWADLLFDQRDGDNPTITKEVDIKVLASPEYGWGGKEEEVYEEEVIKELKVEAGTSAITLRNEDREIVCIHTHKFEDYYLFEQHKELFTNAIQEMNTKTSDYNQQKEDKYKQLVVDFNQFKEDVAHLIFADQLD